MILLGFFICPPISKAADNDIIISEIGAYETSDYEWVEIYNRGSEPIDLNDWKFYEDETNHKLTASQGDLIIEPDEYAIIADVAENFLQAHSDFTGTIIDSSWSSLKESGEKIGLKNSAGETIEEFTYLACPDTSLQRINLNLNDYTENNWQTHAENNSAGQANEFVNTAEQTEDSSADTQDSEESEATEEDEDNTSQEIQPKQQIISSGTILINEFVSDPVSGEDEWIELYNKNGFDVDLSGWKILDGAETATKLSGFIGSNFDNRFLVIEKPKGKLNNAGDAIILQDYKNDIIDAVFYGNWDNQGLSENNAPAANDPFSTARIYDGGTTYNNKNDFLVTQTPTKGLPNVIEPLASAADEKNEATNSDNNAEKINYEDFIIINEIYPNPPGSDLENEWIELKNIGETETDLSDWQIQDASKKNYKISNKDLTSTIIKPHEFLIINRKISGLALNNDKETLKLIAPDDKTIQTIKYSETENIPENASYALNEENEWLFTTTPTKNKENIITQLNHAPIAEIYCPKQALINKEIICDASDSYDLENDSLSFTWQIGEQLFPGVILQTDFKEKGSYQINLTITDGKDQSQESYKIKILEPETQTVTAASLVKTNEDETIAITLPDIHLLEKGTKVTTRGVTAALPNIFGKTVMYLDGIQLYMSKADWPAFKIGDLIQVSGTISEAYGEKRINLAGKDNIIVIENQSPPEPIIIKSSQLGEDLEGHLVQMTGQLIEKNSSKFYVQDDQGEALVYIKQNTKIDKNNFAEGDELTITGLVNQNNDIYQILPRSDEDMIKTQNIKKTDSLAMTANNKSSTVLKYLIVGSIFLSIGLFATFYTKKKAPGSTT